MIGAERDGGLCAADGADGARLWPLAGCAGGTLGAAILALLGIVGKAFGVKKQLLISGEDKVFPADSALKRPICVFHVRLSDAGLIGA